MLKFYPKVVFSVKYFTFVLSIIYKTDKTMKIQLIEKFQYVDAEGNVIQDNPGKGQSICFAREAKQVAVLGEKKNVSKKLPFSSGNGDYFTAHVNGELAKVWLFSGDLFRWPNAEKQAELNGKWFIKL